MGKLRSTMAMSLDGFVAGPDQSVKDPLGVGGMRLHEWMVPLAVFREMHGEDGSGGRGQREHRRGSRLVGERRRRRHGQEHVRRWPRSVARDWRGWWGEKAPYHVPVFVITHHPREPLEMQGGTTFHFITEGIETTLAIEAAGGKDVWLTGGASVIRQFLRAGRLDEIARGDADRRRGVSGARRLYARPA